MIFVPVSKQRSNRVLGVEEVIVALAVVGEDPGDPAPATRRPTASQMRVIEDPN